VISKIASTNGARSGSGIAMPSSPLRYPQARTPVRNPWRAFSLRPIVVQNDSETE
jgi:hypothetical protein